MEPWMKDELVSSIPKEKLEFLAKLFEDGKGKSQKDLMRQLLPLLKEGKEKGLFFTSTETASVIAAIRKHSSAEENAKITALLQKSNHLQKQ